MNRSTLRRLLATAGDLARVMCKPVVLGVLGLAFGLLHGGLLLAAGSMVSDADIVRQLAAWGFSDAAGGRRLPIPVAKTTSYTVVSPLTSAGDPSGTIFTTRGAAGAVTFTLFAPSQALRGIYYDFFGVVGQNLIVNCGGANGIAVNNAAVTTVTCSTASQLIGAHIRATCDGTSWLIDGDSVGVAYTLA